MEAAHTRPWAIFEVVFGVPFLVAIALQVAVPLSLPRGQSTVGDGSRPSLRAARRFVHAELEHVRAGVMAHDIDVEARAGDVGQVEVGQQNPFALP
jgi:hypothetical protein